MRRFDGVQVLVDREMPKRPYFVVDSAWNPLSITTHRGWVRVLRYSNRGLTKSGPVDSLGP